MTERDQAIQAAMESIGAATPAAQAEPTRPTYHFLPPALWMNDPNGLIHHKGWYHMFYQHNPYGEAWGHMHWGHARSRDLVHWEHLPVALWPSKEQGEAHVYSGCATVTPAGEVAAIYTSIPNEDGAKARYQAEQWMALAEDDDLIRWRKSEANPIMPDSIHGETRVFDWRDPFVFVHEGVTYVALGGNTDDRAGKEGAVFHYRAKNDDLTEWEYLGPLYVAATEGVENIECPNFLPLGRKWMLITSPHRDPEYYTGTFDPAKSPAFTPESRGYLDGGVLYAPQVFIDGAGRRIMFGWIRGYREGRGWNGVMTLPRVLSLADDGSVIQFPAPEVELFRGEYMALEAGEGKPGMIDGVSGDALEITARFAVPRSGRVGLRVACAADGSGGAEISWSEGKLIVDGAEAETAVVGSVKSMEIRVFLDRAVLEVFAAGTCVAKEIGFIPGNDRVAVIAEGEGPGLLSLEAWRMKSAWQSA